MPVESDRAVFTRLPRENDGVFACGVIWIGG